MVGVSKLRLIERNLRPISRKATQVHEPKRKDDPKDLSQPFVVEGAAEELDTGLPKAIETHACEILTLERSLQQLKANSDTALAEAKKEVDKKVAEAKNTNKPASESDEDPDGRRTTQTTPTMKSLTCRCRPSVFPLI